jgi:hypothetical protein
MFFPTLGLHRLLSPDIDGGNSETTVELSLDSNSTILVLGNDFNDVSLSLGPESNLILGTTNNDVSWTADTESNLILGTTDIDVLITLST